MVLWKLVLLAHEEVLALVLRAGASIRLTQDVGDAGKVSSLGALRLEVVLDRGFVWREELASVSSGEELEEEALPRRLGRAGLSVDCPGSGPSY